MAYFTVCLTIKDDTPEKRQEVDAYLDPLRTIKEPVSVGLFAGKVDYSKLPLLWRLFFRAAKMQEGDHRNWEAIRAWAAALAPALAV